MEHVDLLFSGLMLTAVMLSLWAAVLLTIACMAFASAFFDQVPAAPNLKAPLASPTVHPPLGIHHS